MANLKQLNLTPLTTMTAQEMADAVVALDDLVRAGEMVQGVPNDEELERLGWMVINQCRHWRSSRR